MGEQLEISMAPKDKLQLSWEKAKREDPQLLPDLAKLAKDLRGQGHKRWSIDALFHVLRWQRASRGRESSAPQAGPKQKPRPDRPVPPPERRVRPRRGWQQALHPIVVAYVRVHAVANAGRSVVCGGRGGGAEADGALVQAQNRRARRRHATLRGEVWPQRLDAAEHPRRVRVPHISPDTTRS